MRKTSVIAVTAALVIGLMTAACAEPVKLEYKFKKDEVTKYKMTMSLAIRVPDLPDISAELPPNINVSMLKVQKVMDVNPDGSAKLKVWTGEVKVTPAEAAGKGKIPAETDYVTISKSGKQLDQKLPAGADSTGLLGEFQQLISEISDYAALPTDPVDVGKTWNKEVGLPMGIGKIDLKSTLASASEKYEGQQAVKITQLLEGQISLDQMMKAFAAAMGQMGGTGEIPEVSGTMGILGSLDTYFSPQLGKTLGQSGGGKLTVDVKMPQELVQQGAPATLRVVMDATINMRITK